MRVCVNTDDAPPASDDIVETTLLALVFHNALLCQFTAMSAVGVPDTWAEVCDVSVNWGAIPVFHLGDHASVTFCGLVFIGNADDIAQLHGEVDVVAYMLTTLSLVGDQQAVICLATEDEVKTPGQSNPVAKSRAHAVASERRDQVRCGA